MIVVPIELGGFGKIFAAVPPAKIVAGGSRRQHHRRLWRLCDARARIGAGAVPLPAFHNRHLGARAAAMPSAAMPRCCRAIPSCSVCLALVGFFAIAAGVGAHAGICRRASSSSATTSRCRRCSCTASRRGLSASLLRRSASARWCRRRSCRSPRPISIPATSTASSSTRIRPTSKKRRWRNGCR